MKAVDVASLYQEHKWKVYEQLSERKSVSLILNFLDIEKIGSIDELVSEIGKLLTDTTSIRTLEIITGGKTCRFVEAILKFPVEKVKLNIDEVTKQEFLQVCRALAENTTLKSLFFFNEDNNPTFNLEEFLAVSNSCETLCIEDKGISFRPKIVKYGRALAKKSVLKRFTLRCSSFSYEAMAPFFEGLSQNTTLKELSLKSITGKEEDPGIVDWDSVVCRGLPINLTTLSVKLLHPGLINAIAKLLVGNTSLKTLKIVSSTCWEAIIPFFEIISRNQTLESLQFRLINKSMNEQTTKEVGRLLKQNTSIKNLFLDTGEHRDIVIDSWSPSLIAYNYQQCLRTYGPLKNSEDVARFCSNISSSSIRKVSFMVQGDEAAVELLKQFPDRISCASMIFYKIIRAETLKALCTFIKTNQVIKSLTIAASFISKEFTRDMLDVVAENQSIKSMDFCIANLGFEESEISELAAILSNNYSLMSFTSLDDEPLFTQYLWPILVRNNELKSQSRFKRAKVAAE